VIDRTKPHYPSFRLSILFVTLGMCVFFWGSGYKLSLYNTGQSNPHSIPAAKLLSKNEDSSATETVRVSLSKVNFAQRHGLFVAAALIAVWSVLPSQPTARCAAQRRVDKLPLRNSLLELIPVGLFFRPPPVHSSI
jgi:hypothetical protein